MMSVEKVIFPPADTFVTEEGRILLASSFEAAKAAGLPRLSSTTRETIAAVAAQQWVPFDQQTPVLEPEKIFDLGNGLFLGSCFGAEYDPIFDPTVIGISAVVNITCGSGRVPNKFESLGVEYINFEVHDQPGETAIRDAIDRGYPIVNQWLDSNKLVLIHCSAGLSRSVTFVVAYLMKKYQISLKDAVEFVQGRRGRKLQINPTFWMELSKIERLLFNLPAGSIPTFDYRMWWREDFNRMGFSDEAIDNALICIGDWTDFETAFSSLLN
jgi:hypothetical protein